MKYGRLPTIVGSEIHVDSEEFLCYQYMPIKMIGQANLTVEPRLRHFGSIIGAACCDFVGLRGLNAFVNHYLYITAKCSVQAEGTYLNRPGWHTDGFLTDDINYIWYDCVPTVFNRGEFNLTADDELSIVEMGQQANSVNNVTYDARQVLRLDQYVVHRCGTVQQVCTRTFLKLSFSKDKYDLKGNTHNYLLDYNWPMRERNLTRNIPQDLRI